MLAVLFLASCGRNKTAEEYVRDAQTRYAAGDLPTAMIDLKNALQRDPKNVAARVLIGQLYLDVSDAQSAEIALLRAREDGADPKMVAKPLAEAELLLGKLQAVLTQTELSGDVPPPLKASLIALRGEALRALGRVDEASRTLQSGLAEDPHSVDVLAAMTRFALSVHDLPTARERLAQAEAESPGNVLLWSLEGAVTFAAGDFAGSERAYQRVRAAAKWNVSALLGIARAEIAEDKLNEADPNLAAVLKVAPSDPNANYLAALLAYRRTDFAGALSHIQLTLKAASDFPPALLLAGAANLATKRYEEANADLRQYVNLVPQNLEARKLLASVELQLGQPGDAVKTLAPAVAQEPADAKLLGLIGVASAQAGDLAAADRYLKLALNQEPYNAGLRTQLGLAEVASGQMDTGIEELERASREGSSALEPDVALFAAYLRSNNLEKAFEIANRVRERHPADATGFDLVGLASFAKGDREAARGALLEARQRRSNDAFALRLLAALALEEGKPDDATSYYQELLKTDPENTQAQLELAEIEIRNGRAGDAVARLTRISQRNPDSIAPRLVLGRVLLTEGRNQEALSAVETALSQHPQDAGLLEIAGLAQLGLGNANAASDTFQRLAGVRPDAATAHRYLAQAYAASRHGDLAVTEARKALDLNPRDASARKLLARLYLSKHGYKDGRPLIESLAAEYPRDPEVAALQGDLAMAEGRAMDAVAAYQRGLAVVDNGILRAGLARVQLQAGRPQEAENTLATWIAAHPEDVPARLSLGDIYMASDRLDDAARQYGAVADQHPNNAIAENNLAWVLSLKGQNGEALVHAQRAAALAPHASEVLDTMGMVLLRNHRNTDAVEALREAATNAPANPDIQFHFAQALVTVGERDEARERLRSLLATIDGTFGARLQAQKLLQDLGG